MSRLSRRRFLQTTAAASTAFPLFTVAGTKASGQVRGANDTIRLGVAGINGRGGSHIDEFTKMKGVQVTYLIDPDSRLFTSRTETVRKRGGNTPKCVQDIREALDDKNLDAISVATCNHWHCAADVLGLPGRQGRLRRKAVSHNVFEGRQCVKAAEKYGRIVQHGTQSRGRRGAGRKQVAAVASGKYGKLLVSKAYASKGRWSIGFKPVQHTALHPGLQPLAGPGARAALPRKPGALQLALVLGNRQRRNRQPGRPPDGHRPLGHPRRDAAESVISMGGRWVELDRRPSAVHRPGRNAQLPVDRHGLRRPAARVRSHRAGQQSGRRRQEVPHQRRQRVLPGRRQNREGKFYPNGSGPGRGSRRLRITKGPGTVFENFIDCMRSRGPQQAVRRHPRGPPVCRLLPPGQHLLSPGPAGPRHATTDVLQSTRRSASPSRPSADRQGHAGPGSVGKHLPAGADADLRSEQETFVDNAEANELLTRNYREPFVVTEEV